MGREDLASRRAIKPGKDTARSQCRTRASSYTRSGAGGSTGVLDIQTSTQVEL